MAPKTHPCDEPDEPRVFTRRLTSLAFGEALVAAGIVQDLHLIRRIVIDVKAGDVVVMHVERFGDTRLLDVVRGLDGIEIRESLAPTLEVNEAGYPTGGWVDPVDFDG
jgi:hypothetical protein